MWVSIFSLYHWNISKILFNTKFNKFYWTDHCHKLWLCKFLLNTLRTSSVNRNASNIGKRFNNAVSEVSENHDFIGIALSKTYIQ